MNTFKDIELSQRDSLATMSRSGFSSLWIKYSLLLLLIVSFLLPIDSTAQSRSFEGLTIIDLSDENGEAAIRGGRDIGARETGQYLVTYLSGRGSYATLMGSQRGCVAWLAGEGGSGASLSFGLPHDRVAKQNVHPKICNTFTLTYQDDGQILIEAGLLSSGGYLYSTTREPWLRIPSISFDWNLRHYDHHTIRDVRLGPLPIVRSSVESNAEVSVSEANKWFGFLNRKEFEAVYETLPENAAPRVRPERLRIRGMIAEFGPSPDEEVLYAFHAGENYKQASMNSTFNEAVIERYGQASALTRSERIKHWIYDQAGNQLFLDVEQPSNTACLVTSRFWLNNDSIVSITNDIGPWGCGLIMLMEHRGSQGVVNGYRIEIIDAGAMAINHFNGRLDEMQRLKDRVQKLESARPRL